MRRMSEAASSSVRAVQKTTGTSQPNCSRTCRSTSSPPHVRQIPVDDEEIKAAALHGRQTGAPIGEHFDLMPFAFQQRLEHLGLAATIFHHRENHKTSHFAQILRRPWAVGNNASGVSTKP